MSGVHRLQTADERVLHRLGLALLWLVLVAPLAWSLGYSLLYSTGGIGLLSDGWTLDHWRAALATGGLTDSILLSLSVAGIVTLLATSGALAIALAAPPAPRRSWLPVLLCVPLATPAVVAALIAYQVLNPGGLLGRFAFLAGWIESPSGFPTLVNDPWSLGIVVTQTLLAFPLLTLFFLGTWTSARIDRYSRLAESLGATRRQARLRVALPMLLRRGTPLILLVFLWQLGAYEIPLLLGRQSPQMFSVLTQRRFGQFDLEDRPEAFALAVTYLLLAAAGLLLLLYGKHRRAAS